MDPKPKKWSEMTDEERQAAVVLRQEKLDQARLKLENGVTQLVAHQRYLGGSAEFHRLNHVSTR